MSMLAQETTHLKNFDLAPWSDSSILACTCKCTCFIYMQVVCKSFLTRFYRFNGASSPSLERNIMFLMESDIIFRDFYPQ